MLNESLYISTKYYKNSPKRIYEGNNIVNHPTTQKSLIYVENM